MSLYAQRPISSVCYGNPDPTDEELARDWTLSETDRLETLRCRGGDSRLRFAVQLCMMRLHGRFLNGYDDVPVRILNHLSRQLDLPPVLFLEPATREATELDHQRRVREHLEFRTFDSEIKEELARWVHSRMAEGALPTELVQSAEDVLRSWKVILPAPSTLKRIVAAASVDAQERIFLSIEERLTPEFCQTLDELLDVPEGDQRSVLIRLKAYPPKATPTSINLFIERYTLLCSLGVGGLDFREVKPDLICYLAQLVRRYKAKDLKRFVPTKRHALVACFLFEVHKSILDYLVLMHDQYLITMNRRSRNALAQRRRQTRRRAKKGMDTVLMAMEFLLEPKRQLSGTALTDLYHEVEQEHLHEALFCCREFQRLEDRGYVDELLARHSHLKQYLPSLLKLSLRAEQGSQHLIAAVKLARKLHAGEIRSLPSDTSIQFVPTAWRTALFKEDGQLDHRLWEIAIAFALRDTLRSGDLYLPESRHHISFWNLVHDEARWNSVRKQSFQELNMPIEADQALARLREEFNQVANSVDRGLPNNLFASIKNGRLKLKRRDRLEVSNRVEELRRVVGTNLPQVRIEELLMEVDSWCHFTQELRPLGGYRHRLDNHYETLLAALVAQGTNLGIATMSQSAVGVTVDKLRHVSRWFLRTETLKAANKVLIDYHHGLELSSVWGDGTVSSSDGQRFGIEASSLLASFYPRYFGYYDKAITVYTHTSDQHSVFATRAISCSPREAIYVLDGLLENDTVLEPKQHSTDTHGFTEQLFGLCYILGYSFMPRISNLPGQQLYCLDWPLAQGRLEPLFRKSVNTDLIGEQWDQLVRVAASLGHRTAPAHVVLRRLGSSAPSDRLAKALTALGRVVKTIFILRYIHDPSIRQSIQLQLNRGEFRHGLAQRLFFANQGVFDTGDYEEIMNKVSSLSVLSNAVLVWNTIKMSEIIDQLRSSGEAISGEELSHLCPLAFTHVIPNGTYHFTPSS